MLSTGSNFEKPETEPDPENEAEIEDTVGSLQPTATILMHHNHRLNSPNSSHQPLLMPNSEFPQNMSMKTRTVI